MVKGFLSTFGFRNIRPAPAVQGFVYLSRLGMSRWIEFLVDTGASNTCLHGPVALPLQRRMRPSTLSPSLGIGGVGRYYRESAVLVLVEEDGNLLPYDVDLRIQQIRLADFRRPPNPSLLGCDVLEYFDLRVNLRVGEVLLSRLP